LVTEMYACIKQVLGCCINHNRSKPEA
jgi:hypothetical protein